MKLTRNKLIEVIRRKNEGWTSYQARKIAGISVRRVDQVYKLKNTAVGNNFRYYKLFCANRFINKALTSCCYDSSKRK